MLKHFEDIIFSFLLWVNASRSVEKPCRWPPFMRPFWKTGRELFSKNNYSAPPHILFFINSPSHIPNSKMLPQSICELTNSLILYKDVPTRLYLYFPFFFHKTSNKNSYIYAHTIPISFYKNVLIKSKIRSSTLFKFQAHLRWFIKFVIHI